MQLESLGEEELLKKKMATHSSILAVKIHGQRSLMSYSPWGFPGKNTGVSCHFLLQGIFPTQGSNTCLPSLLHCRWIFYPLSHGGSHCRTVIKLLIVIIVLLIVSVPMELVFIQRCFLHLSRGSKVYLIHFDSTSPIFRVF